VTLCKLVASQIIHNVIRKHKPQSFWERLFGTKMCVVVTKPHFDANPASCWWALIKRSEDVRLVQLKALGECVSKLGALAPTPSLGLSAPGPVGDMLDLDHESSKIFGQLDSAWKAATWAAAKKAGQEFAIGVSKATFVLGGPATFQEQGEKLNVKLLPYSDYQNTFISFMSHAERQGAAGEAGYTAGLMEACGTLTYQFDTKAGTLTAIG